jgi:hypothetical protein
MAPLPYLNWPIDLFASLNATATLMIDKLKSDGLVCACGCGLPHNLAYSGLEGDHGYRTVVWFRTMRCKAAYLMERASVH